MRRAVPMLLILFQALGALSTGAADRAGDGTGGTAARGETGSPPSSYEVFLPSAYTPDRKWPILYCFDPGGRGAVPIDLFRAAAERDGFIIASSNEFRSGAPVDRSLQILSHIWNDTMRRYAIDLDRVAAAGFSGGGRLCWILDRATNDVSLSGIIEVGAGLPSPDFLTAWEPAGLAYCGLAGETDFNYYEMRSLDRRLRGLGFPSRIIPFDGGHRWPSAEMCGRALDWIRLQGMRNGKAPKDGPFIEDLYGRELACAEAVVDSGWLLEGAEAFRDVAEGFEGLRDVTEARTRRSEIERDAAFEERRRAREAADRKGRERIERCVAVLDEIARGEEGNGGNGSPGVRDLDRDLDLTSLLAEGMSEDRDVRLGAERALAAIFVRASSSVPQDLEKRGRYETALRVLAVAARIRPGDPAVLYDLAAAHARAGHLREAVDALDRAISAGFVDRDRLRSDPELESVRADTSFSRIMRRLPD